MRVLTHKKPMYCERVAGLATSQGILHLSSKFRVEGLGTEPNTAALYSVQGYLTYKKTQPPRNLPQACA